MTEERYKPDSDVEETREVRIDIPRLGPQIKTAEIIDGMAVVEGDIVLGPADEFSDVGASDTPEDVAYSIGLRAENAFWPDGVVPYEIDSSMPRQYRVDDAIQHWEDNTPIRFVERTDEDDYVQFFDGSGCWSYIGRQGGKQLISIDTGCGTGSTIHEIAHALGFWHIQSRSDRDVYITINWENIRDGVEGNFRKHEEANDIGQYDYGSIMHYGAYAFSTGGKTIEAPEPIGQRRGLSAGDIESVYRIYGPSDAGAVTSVTDDWHELEFDPDISPDPVVLTGVQTFNGSNTVGVRMRDLGDSSAEVFLEEEESTDSETRHIEEDLGFFATDEGELFDENANLIGGADTVSVSQGGPSDWLTLSYDRSLSNPVVFMQLQSYNGSQPAHLRVRDVGSGRFRCQIEEWEYLDQRHTEEEIGFVVLEEGTHTLRNGIELEVGTVDTDHRWQSVSTDVPTDPVILSQCQTYNGSDPVVTRHRNVDRNSFDVRLQEEEARGTHLTETIGYVSVSPPLEFEFGIAQDEVTHEWGPLDYEADFKSTPATVASISTYNGTNTADVRMKQPGPEVTQLQIEEEESDEPETDHKAERVAYVAAPEGPIVLPDATQIGEAGTVTRNQPAESKWYTIDLDGKYRASDLAVFAQVMSKNGWHPAHVRLRDVEPDSFDFQIEEWEYLDQWHTEETIGYVVLECGVHHLPGGELLKVGTTRTNHSWKSVSLDSRLHGGDAVDATVVSRCQTYNGGQAVVTRQRNVSPTGFDVRLQEEEDHEQRHKTETIGYIAGVR